MRQKILPFQKLDHLILDYNKILHYYYNWLTKIKIFLKFLHQSYNKNFQLKYFVNQSFLLFFLQIVAKNLENMNSRILIIINVFLRWQLILMGLLGLVIVRFHLNMVKQDHLYLIYLFKNQCTINEQSKFFHISAALINRFKVPKNS